MSRKKMIAWAFSRQCPNSNAKLVLLHLSARADAKGYCCWAPYSLVAWETELDQRCVRACIKLLAKHSLLRIERYGRNRLEVGYHLAVELLNRPPRRPRAGRSHVAANSGTGADSKIIPCAPSSSPNDPRESIPALAARRAKIEYIKTRVSMLRKEIGEGPFRVWFSDTNFMNKQPTIISMPTTIHVHAARGKYFEVLQRIFGKDVQIILRIPL
jgi:hypothetical protein